MTLNISPAIIDEAYEAAFIPERWPTVLSTVAKNAGCQAATMFLASKAKSHFVVTENGHETFENCIRAGVMDLSRNPRAMAMLARNHPGFVTDQDVVSPDIIDSHPMYLQGLRPTGYGWGAGTFVPLVTGDTLIFSIEKLYANGPVTPEEVAQLDLLRPHLARTALTSARISFERMSAALGSLAEIGLPAFAVDDSCQQLAENSLMAELRPYLIQGAFNSIGFVDRKANELFRSAVLAIDDHRPGHSRSFAVEGSEGEPPAVLHVLPIRKNAHDIFGRASAVIVGNLPSPVRHPNADLLNNIFDLTPAQSRVARLLLTGKSLQQAASELRLSRETVKSHLKIIFAKTGTHRQAELLKLLSSISAPSN